MSERRNGGPSPNIFRGYDRVEWLASVIGEREAAELIVQRTENIRTQLSSADLIDMYDAEYVRGIHGHPPACMVRDVFRVNVYQKPVFDLLLGQYGNAEARILDVGCGTGEFILALASQGFECVGVDYNAKMIEVGRALQSQHAQLLPIAPQLIAQDVGSLNPAAKFDAITLNDVIEHLSVNESISLLEKCRKLLRPSGSVFVHTPNGRNFMHWTERTLKSRLLYLIWRYVFGGRTAKGLRQAYYDQTHINILGPSALTRIARRAGFHAVTIHFDERRSPGLTDVYCSNMTAVLQ